MGWSAGNNFLLENLEVSKIIEEEIRYDFQVNKGPANGIIVWECFKSYICGILISQLLYRLKKNKEDKKKP